MISPNTHIPVTSSFSLLSSVPLTKTFDIDAPTVTMRNLQNAGTKNVTTKTKYKDYTDFLDNYKKDDQESVASFDSGFSGGRLNGSRSNNASNSSLSSEASSVTSLKSSNSFSKASYGSYKEFLENYNTKKYSSVKPNVPVQRKNTVKSELFVQINGDKNGIDQNKWTKEVVSPRQVPSPEPAWVKNERGTLKNGTDTQKSVNNKLQMCRGPVEVGGIPPPPKLPPADFSVKKHAITNGSVPPPPKMPVNTSPKRIPNSPPKEERNGTKFVPPTQEILESRLKKLNAVDAKYDRVDFDTTTVVAVDENGKIDKNDPNVKKLVYNTYRGLLGAYNNKANHMVSTLPRSMVREDKGIAKQLESIA